MSPSDSFVPPGWPAVIPRLSVDKPHEMVQFLKEVFGAKGELQENRPSELSIGDSLIMVGGTLKRMPTTSFLYVYVEDVDRTYEKAIFLGANDTWRVVGGLSAAGYPLFRGYRVNRWLHRLDQGRRGYCGGHWREPWRGARRKGLDGEWRR